ncbi:MAG TPA: hypothetical protein VH682_12450 [Gemmataceae bacterium]|jgi:hypothetical protein
MSTAARRRKPSEPASANEPLYELRLIVPKRGDPRAEVWQLPSTATPLFREPLRLASLTGRGWRLIEARLLRRLAQARIAVGSLTPGSQQNKPLAEDTALNLALLFRTLAPMRNLDNIRQAADGIDAMSREEAGYWLGMALHRRFPRRVLAALRLLLTSP